MSKIILLEDEYGPALLANSLIEIYKHEVDLASDLREFIYLFEISRNKVKYDVILLDLTVPGIIDYEIPGTDDVRTCYDYEGMHGYRYFYDQRNIEFKNYTNRLAFYTAFSGKLKSRAKRDGIDINTYRIFNKADTSAEEINNWIRNLPGFKT